MESQFDVEMYQEGLFRGSTGPKFTKMAQIGPKRAPNLSGIVSKIGYKGKEKLKVSIEM